MFFFLFLTVVNFFMSNIEEACQKKVGVNYFHYWSHHVILCLHWDDYPLLNWALKGKRNTNRRKPRTAGPLQLSTAQPYHYLMMELLWSYRDPLTLHSVRFFWSIDVQGVTVLDSFFWIRLQSRLKSGEALSVLRKLKVKYNCEIDETKRHIKS